MLLAVASALQELARFLLEACIDVDDVLLRVGSGSEHLLRLAMRVLLTRIHLILLTSHHGASGAALRVKSMLILTWLHRRWLSVARRQIRISGVSAVRLISDVDLLKVKRKAAINFKFQNFDNDRFTKNEEQITYMAI